jgi:hypothetical protein
MSAAFEALSTACPRCGNTLAAEIFQSGGAACYDCGSQVEGAVFPALFADVRHEGDALAVADEATCFFHADRVAAVSCSRCGRFLCNLCRISWPAGDVCPACVQEGAALGNPAEMAASRFHFDTVALLAAVLPILGLSLTILSAPVALGFAVFTYRKECSIAPRSKIRFVLAILVSLLLIAGWVALIVFSIRNSLKAAGR